MSKIGIAVLGFAALLTGGAAAADLTARPNPTSTAAYNWSGCSLGANSGGARSVNEWGPLGGVALNNVDASGYFIGGQIGCDYQSGHFVFGIEGAFDWSPDLHSTAVFSNGVGGQLESKLQEFATATGRIGYAFDRALIYTKGGLAWGHFNHELDQIPANVPVPEFSGAQNVAGVVVGGGIEVAFAPHWSFDVDYDYIYFGTNNVPLSCVNSGLCPVNASIPFDIRQDVQVVTFGLNYRFGSGWVTR